MKSIWIIANWKSNKNIAEALEWVSVVGPKIPKKAELNVVVCPPFSDLAELKKAVQIGGFPIMIGSQDLSPFEIGAYTGEEPAAILNQFVELAILGHSERRQNFGETDQLVAAKTAQALANGIIPLVCVQGRETPIPEGAKLVAYEPVFAIGTGTPDTPENAQNVAQELKSKNPQLAVLYGGSVNSTNLKSFLAQPDISGVLIGKASLDAIEFGKIIGTAVQE